jgi:hypothetical protein
VASESTFFHFNFADLPHRSTGKPQEILDQRRFRADDDGSADYRRREHGGQEGSGQEAGGRKSCRKGQDCCGQIVGYEKIPERGLQAGTCDLPPVKPRKHRFFTNSERGFSVFRFTIG